jgi:hypothetical protein
LAIGVAPQATMPEAELFGPCKTAFGAPRTQAHARPGMITGSNITVVAGDATGTTPFASGRPKRSS